MMFYDPATGRVHDFINYAEGEFVKNRPTTEADAQEHGWLLDERTDAEQIREKLRERLAL